MVRIWSTIGDIAHPRMHNYIASRCIMMRHSLHIFMAAFSLAVCPTAAHTASAADGKKGLPSPATAIERRREQSGWRGQAPWWRKHHKVLTLGLMRILCDSSVTPGRHCHMCKRQEQCAKIFVLRKPEASASIRVAQIVELDA